MPGIDVIVCPLERDPAFLADMRALLAADECDRADRFRFAQHRDAFVAARGMLRTLLGRRTGTDPAAIRFAYADHGKPSIPSVHFNLSHSGGLALVAICDEVEIGIDIERIHPLNDLEDLARRFFFKAEFDDLMAVPTEVRVRAFFNCWTRKEAFIKAVGSGLSYPLNRFQVTLDPASPARFVHIEDRPGDDLPWSLHDLPVPEGYVAALAVPHRDCQITVAPFEL